MSKIREEDILKEISEEIKKDLACGNPLSSEKFKEKEWAHETIDADSAAIFQAKLEALIRQLMGTKKLETVRIEKNTVTFERAARAVFRRPFMHLVLRPDRSENELESRIWGEKRNVLDCYKEPDCYVDGKNNSCLIR